MIKFPYLKSSRNILWIALVLLLIGLQGCATHAPYSYQDEPRSKGQAVAQTALSQIGTRYKFGGKTPKSGFDCSGLVLWSYGQHGINMPRVAKDQMQVGQKIPKNKLRPGDVVGFKLSRTRYHTGIYIGNGKFVHSPSKGKTVRVETLDSDYWKKRLISIRRVL